MLSYQAVSTPTPCHAAPMYGGFATTTRVLRGEVLGLADHLPRPVERVSSQHVAAVAEGG